MSMQNNEPAAAGRNPMPPFEHRTALIYGSGRNIGREIAREFARRGARVAVADIDLAAANETVRLIAEAGGDATALQCDVMSNESVRETAAEAERRIGAIDILMNNAGILHSGNPEDFPMAEWERMISCNLLAMVRSIEFFMPKMIARGSGYIVNTASFAGLYPYAINRIPYAVSKAGVLSLTENLAIYLLPKGVRVSCLCPGPVMTDSPNSMKTFSGNVGLVGPGSHLRIKSQVETAKILADGMCAGRIVIPTHEEGLETLRQHAASPDEFIRAKIEAFSRGDHGKPSL
jgi:NAD(P)-dependent dehydrogenase (short-subunit alcohol dehydrogenase family)